jgi:hypothetical protein
LPSSNETISLPVSGGDNDLVSYRQIFLEVRASEVRASEVRASEVRAYSQTLDMMLADLKPVTIAG